ncbi:MAG TPA: hypothetical protein VJM11_17890 [Nevskiaceae bacterium]|nr:hypothetical protein [Nevskiaceae bacterium]
MLASLKNLMLAVSVAAVLTGTAGCSSGKKIDPSSSESIINGVNKGDEVRIGTKNGATHKFVVTKITNKALYGDNARVVYDDIQSIEVKGKEGFFSKLF